MNPETRFLVDIYCSKQGFIVETGFLCVSPTNNQQSQEKIETLCGYGSWAGKIIMSDDFDEPLEDFAAYM